MSEFGEQIDVEYEVWETDGVIHRQVHTQEHGYLSMDKDSAQRIAREHGDTRDDLRVYVVEVVSVRTEYGVEVEDD
jgi:hypothetical protein